MLFADKGFLDYLECIVHDPEGDPMNELPPPDQLDVYTLPRG